MKTFERNDIGFTLIEMLVSLALLAMMSIYALQSFRTLNQMDLIGRRMQGQNEVNAVVHHLATELSGARIAFADAGTAQQRLLFSSSGKSLNYVTASNGDRETGGLYLVTLSVDATGSLISNRQLLRSDGSGPSEAVTLLSDVKSLTFSFDETKPADEVLHEWIGKDHLPAAAEIKVGFEIQDQRHWPGLTVRMMLGT